MGSRPSRAVRRESRPRNAPSALNGAGAQNRRRLFINPPAELPQPNSTSTPGRKWLHTRRPHLTGDLRCFRGLWVRLTIAGLAQLSVLPGASPEHRLARRHSLRPLDRTPSFALASSPVGLQPRQRGARIAGTFAQRGCESNFRPDRAERRPYGEAGPTGQKRRSSRSFS